MKTLTLDEAAKFLKVHPVTLAEKARQGTIPGTKIGRRWVFIEDDLVAYLRSQYDAPRQATHIDMKEQLACQYTVARTPHIGGSASPTTESEYSSLLGLMTEKRRSSTTTG